MEAVGVEILNKKSKTKKEKIGSVLALYPTPATVVATMVDGKANFMMLSHIGIIGHNRIMISMSKRHHSNKAVHETKLFSINLVDEALLPRADYAGTVSGANEDKSSLFEFTIGEEGMPIIVDSPLTMECVVEDVYETEGFDNFICKIANTYASDEILTAEGKIDYNILKPMLARGELHCIGATTLDEYRKYIEKDPALEGRFQPVLANEPSVEDTISILRG